MFVTGSTFQSSFSRIGPLCCVSSPQLQNLCQTSKPEEEADDEEAECQAKVENTAEDQVMAVEVL